jgi:hypothetical protein
MKKLTKKVLLEHLDKSEKEDIINEIITLFGKFENVKEFYRAELSGGTNPVLETYKKKITKAYSSINPSERRTNRNVNKLIIDFKKVCIYRNELIDILLFRVESGVEAFIRNNKRSETFYNSIVTSFKDAVNIIVSEKIMEEFQQRIFSIIKNSEAGKYSTKERMEEMIRNFD